MSVTVTANLTTISLCESLTGWTAVGGTNSLNDPTVFDQKQGSYCIQNYNASSVDRGSDYTILSTNFSDTTIYCWFAFSKVPHATNYMRIRLTDSAGNWREWNIFNKSNLPHIGWIAWALKTSVAYDSQSATPPVMTNITKVGWRMSAVIAKVYIYFDAWRYGTGLSIKGGDSGTPAVFDDFITAESTNAYGIIEKFNDVYFVQGKIIIGSLTANESTYFKDTNRVIVFGDIYKTPSGFYEIKGQNATSGSGTTEIYLGDNGVFGCVIKASTNMKFLFNMSDTYITKFDFGGCSFINANTITGQSYSVNKQFRNCNFISCSEILPYTGIVNGCNFITSGGRAVRISENPHYVTNCQFINCQTAVHHNVGGAGGTPYEYDYDNLKFSGNTYDIENSAVTPNFYIDIDRLNGSNPDVGKINNSAGGTTTILTIAVVLTLTGLIASSEVRIYNAGTTTELDGVENSETTFQYLYNYGEYPNIDIVVHKADRIYYRLNNYTPGSTNANLPIVQQFDRQYQNP